MVRRTVSRTPDQESDHATMSVMSFYVPATSRDGEVTTLEYDRDADGDNQADELVETREFAKPLVSTYIDEVESSGAHDAWVAVSLDDGLTWKQTNLSESALESSFQLANGFDYPGDVTRISHAVAGNKVFVVWTSTYASQGSPRYSLKDDSGEDLYEDAFGVAGSQGSIDYTEYQHHGEFPFADVGEIPFSAVWCARGTVERVEPGDGSGVEGPVWGVRWRKAERLTSGRRDAFYLAVAGAEGAGFAAAWQEDPEGLRPGSGEGPGVGWSGATVNHQTDIWYSHIGWDDFDLVRDDDGNLVEDPDSLETNKPKVYERMSMPVRISDNAKVVDYGITSVEEYPVPEEAPYKKPLPYWFKDWNGDHTPDLIAGSFQFTNSQGEDFNIAVTQDGRLLNGQTGASRARMSAEEYTRADGTTGAWIVLAYEETKGLGVGHEDDEPLDIGKNVKYHSFELSEPDLVAPGTMMNLPETDPASDPENPEFLPWILNDKAEYQYQTSIGRRPSLLVQPGDTIAQRFEAGTSDGLTSVVLLYKDGLERQGGPSDIFMRRFVLDADFDPALDNPYDVKYLVADEWDTEILSTCPSGYPASAYPNGVALRGAVNLSTVTPLTFEPLDNDSDGEIPSHGITDRVLSYEQTEDNLDDEHWANPYEVAKGHRGFIDGDFVMAMYAYSPNWLATSHGNEPYNLHIRRSFDGGETWTTTPAALGGDGTTYDQPFSVGDRTQWQTVTLAPGEFEPARNVSKIITSKETVLDPRYSPTLSGTPRVLTEDGTYLEYPEGLYADDVRDPSKFFGVYETGDATTVEEGEAEPLNLYASRATNWGDDWDTEDVFAQGRGEWDERWDWLENKQEAFSGEASIAGSASGAFMWAVWNQWEYAEDGEVIESDPVFRRMWWDDAAPVILVDAGTYTAEAGEVVTLTASATYADSTDGDFVYFWDLDLDGYFETEGQTVEIASSGSSQAVAVQAVDPNGYTGLDQGWINESGHPLRVWKVEVTPEAVPAGIPEPEAVASARFTNLEFFVFDSAVIDWGDGTSEPPSGYDLSSGNGASVALGSHVYPEAGFYPVTVTVADADGTHASDTLYHAVVYDRGNGNVEGDDLIYRDPNTGGLALLTFTARYPNPKDVKLDPTVPVGKVKLRAEGVQFETETFDWFVATRNGDVFLQGRDGVFNGMDNYNCLVSAKVGKPGLIRVRIWKSNGTNRRAVYDTDPDGYHDHVGALDLSTPNVPILKGKLKLED